MKKYLLLFVMIGAGILAHAQTINPYAFYKSHEDTRGFWPRTHFDEVIANFNLEYKDQPDLLFTIRTVKQRIAAAALIKQYEVRKSNPIQTLSVIHGMMCAKKVMNGDTVVNGTPRKVVIAVQLDGKLYGLYVWWKKHAWHMHVLDPNHLWMAQQPFGLRKYYIDPGVEIISEN